MSGSVEPRCDHRPIRGATKRSSGEYRCGRCWRVVRTGIPCLELIKKAVIRAGNQYALAREIGKTRQAVSLWANGITNPSEVSYKKLLKFVRT